MLPPIRSTRAPSRSAGISNCSRRTISAASAAWAKACRCRSPRTAAASSGSRMKARRRISPPSTCPIRAIRRSSCRPTCRKPHALELARRVRRHHGGRLSDAESRTEAGRARAVRHFGAGKAALDRVLRLLGPEFARRASAVVLRRRIRAHGVRRARLQAEPIRTTTSSTAASTCAIRRSRRKSAAGGCPARARSTTSRRRRATRSTRAIARTTPTSIRSGPTGSISATSTAACS